MAEKYTPRMVEEKAMMALFLKPTATLKFLVASTFQLYLRYVPGIRLTPYWMAWLERVALTIMIQKGTMASRLRKVQNT